MMMLRENSKYHLVIESLGALVLSTSLVSGVPNMVWPPVKQKSSTEVVD